MSETSERIKIEWAENDAKRDAGLLEPENIEQYTDIVYGDDPYWNTLDVYRLKGKNGRLPVIISVHGGGWVYGDKELYRFYCMSLAQRQFAVINFTYRLAPEHKFPKQLEDVNRVVEWVLHNEEQYHFDTENIFMVGDSSGGHLAALYTEICTNQAYAQKFTFHIPEKYHPKAIGFNCGVFNPNMSFMECETESRDLVTDLIPKGEEWREIIDATKYITADFPHIFKIYGTDEEPLYHVFHVTIQEKIGQICNDEECEFFRSTMV